MANPTLVKSHEIDIQRWNGSAYEFVCGITSFDWKMTRASRDTKVRDCAVAFAPPTMARSPGALEDCTFSGSGKLDADYREEFKSLWQSTTPTLFKLAISGFGTLVGSFVITELGFTSDAIDEAGYVEVSLALALNGTITWTND